MVLALGLRVAMAWAIPFASGTTDPNCAPDESVHFELVTKLAEGHAPVWPEESWSIYAAFPPPQYFAQALSFRLGRAVEWGRFEPQPWARGFQAARFGSSVLGMLSAGAGWLAAWFFGRSRLAALAVGVLIALYPCAVFLGAYSNGDSFTLFVAALHVAALARWAHLGEGREGLFALAFTAGLVLVGKPSGFFLLPPTAVWLVWAWRTARVPFASLVRASGMTLLAGGPALAWNGFRNHGDVLGLQRYHRFVEDVLRPAGMAMGKNTEAALFEFFTVLPRSAFARFRNNDLELPGEFYWVALVLVIISLVVTVRAVASFTGLERRALRWAIASALVNGAMVFLNFWLVDYQLQGRYLVVTSLIMLSVFMWAPTRVFTRPWAQLWVATFLCFFAVAAVVSQVTVFKHPCVPFRLNDTKVSE